MYSEARLVLVNFIKNREGYRKKYFCLKCAFDIFSIALCGRGFHSSKYVAS